MAFFVAYEIFGLRSDLNPEDNQGVDAVGPFEFYFVNTGSGDQVRDIVGYRPEFFVGGYIGSSFVEVAILPFTYSFTVSVGGDQPDMTGTLGRTSAGGPEGKAAVGADLRQVEFVDIIL